MSPEFGEPQDVVRLVYTHSNHAPINVDPLMGKGGDLEGILANAPALGNF